MESERQPNEVMSEEEFAERLALINMPEDILRAIVKNLAPDSRQKLFDKEPRPIVPDISDEELQPGS